MEIQCTARESDLPEILATPPWKAEKKQRGKLPQLVDAAWPPYEEGLDWRDGERVDWTRLVDTETNIFPGYLKGVAKALHLPVSIEKLAVLLDGHAEQARELVRRGAEAKRATLVSKDRWRWHYHIERLLQLPWAVRRLILVEYPAQIWTSDFYHPVAEKLAADHGFDAFDALLGLAQFRPEKALPALGPFRSPRAVPVVVAAMAKKTGRAPALGWLHRQGDAAAAGLPPFIASAKGKVREQAIEALHLVRRQVSAQRILELADSASPEVGEVARAVLALDPRDLYPKKLPKMPGFWRPEAFARPVLRDGGGALPAAAMEVLGTMLAFTPTDVPYAGLDDVCQACQPASLAAFAWDLFQAWKMDGMPAKEKWAFTTLGFFGDDESARRLAELVRVWPGDGGHQRAVTGLDILARIGTDVALMHLNGIAQKLRYKGLKEKAREKIEQIAEHRGLSRDELSDRLVPTLGLDAEGTMWLDFGPRQFRVGFDEHLKPFVRDSGGAARKTLPKPRKDDDVGLAKASSERFKALKKDVRALSGIELSRLEQAMCSGRRWSGDDFRRFLALHPLLGHLVRRLLWGAYDEDCTCTGAFRVAEDGSFADADDEPWTLPEGHVVGLAHALDLSEAQSAALAEVLADYEILQPFEQLGRDVHELSEEHLDSTALDLWRGMKVPTGRVLGLEKRGWRRGEAQDAGIIGWYERPLPSRYGELMIVLDIDPGVIVGLVTEFPEQELGEVYLSDVGGWGVKKQPFSGLDPVTISEMVRDLESLWA